MTTSTPLTLQDGLRRFIVELGLDALIHDVDEGVEVLRTELASVALDVHRAELRQVSLSEAARDQHNHPSLFRLHTMFADVLTTTLDPMLIEWVRQILKAPPVELLEDLDVGLAAAAIDPSQPPMIRHLARLGLWEMVRLGLLLQDHLAGEQNVYARGQEPEHLDAIAEAEMQVYLSIAEDDSDALDGITPRTIFASAMIMLSEHAKEIREAIGAAATMIEMQERARLEHELRQLDRRDELLLRYRDLDEEQVSLERLIDRHPIPFGDRRPTSEAVRRHRLMNGDGPPRTRAERGAVALLDLLKEEVER